MPFKCHFLGFTWAFRGFKTGLRQAPGPPRFARPLIYVQMPKTAALRTFPILPLQAPSKVSFCTANGFACRKDACGVGRPREEKKARKGKGERDYEQNHEKERDGSGGDGAPPHGEHRGSHRGGGHTDMCQHREHNPPRHPERRLFLRHRADAGALQGCGRRGNLHRGHRRALPPCPRAPACACAMPSPPARPRRQGPFPRPSGLDTGG